MESGPIELAPDKIGCPECRSPLEPRLVPVYHDGSKLGAFDGMACEMCGYGQLTEKGRDAKGLALEALDRALLSYTLDNAAETCVVSGTRSSPVTQGNFSAEKTAHATPAVFPPPVIMALRKSRKVTARLA